MHPHCVGDPMGHMLYRSLWKRWRGEKSIYNGGTYTAQPRHYIKYAMEFPERLTVRPHTGF